MLQKQLKPLQPQIPTPKSGCCCRTSRTETRLANRLSGCSAMYGSPKPKTRNLIPFFCPLTRPGRGADPTRPCWRDLSPFSSLRSPQRALPTETNVESGTSQSESGNSVNLSDSGNPKPETLNLKPLAPNPKPQLLNPKP